MASLNGTFNANDVEPNAPRETLPPGDYVVQIVRSDMKATKNGAGQYLEIELTILEGSHINRKLFDRLNLVNANQQAVDIANRTLSAICHATGQMTVSDSEQLHFKPMVAKVAVRPSGPDKSGVMRDTQNEVRGYSAVNGAQPAHAKAHTAPGGAAPAAKGAPPPWRRSAAG